MAVSTRHNDWSPRPASGEAPAYDGDRFQRSARGRRLWRRESRIVDAFLDRLPARSTVLDVPAGMGRFTNQILAYQHRPISIDLLFEHVRHIATQSHTAADTAADTASQSAIQADIGRLPLADGAVDAVLCIRLLHHLTPPQIATALAELNRVAGRALITFYSRHSFKYLKKRLRGRPTSGRYYPPSTLTALCLEAGWTGCRSRGRSPWHNLHFLELTTTAADTAAPQLTRVA